MALVLTLAALGCVGVALAVIGLMFRDGYRVEASRRRARALNDTPEQQSGA